MAMLKISQFGGMLPKVGTRILPDSAAVYAANIKLQSGTPEPISPPGLSTALTNITSIFLARDGTTDNSWFSWNIDVDCVRVPLPTDVESRFCWAGDGAPKTAKYSTAISGGGGAYPYSYYDLGIPTPTAKPTMTPPAGSAITRFYCYTFYSQDGEESGPSPLTASATGAIAGTWALAGMDVAPANSGTGTATATTFTNAASAKTWLRVGDQVAFGSAPTTYRTVTALPSTSSFSVTGASIAAETTWARRANWNTTGLTKRIYRTTGTTGFFALVIDAIAAATTSYNDTILDDAILGDELLTTGWEPPPVGLTGLCVHSSGALAGFTGNVLCFSEPLQPHAWVTANQLAAAFDGVGIAAYGQSVVLATRGSPFIVTGTEPESMSGETVDGVHPCLSKRSVVSIGNGVIYAADAGLAMVGAAGAGLFTQNHYTRKEWAVLNPSTMVCAVSSGRVYVKTATDAGVTSVLVFDDGQLVVVETSVSSMFSDVPSGELYVGKTGGAYLWDDAAQVRMSGGWKSKEFVFPKPVNIGAAKVDFTTAVSASEEAANVAAIAAAMATNAAERTSGKVRGAINTRAVDSQAVNGSDFVDVPASISNSVVFNLYGGPSRSLLGSKTVTDTKVFRLPSGYKYDNFQIEVATQSSIAEIRIAETPAGLRDA